LSLGVAAYLPAVRRPRKPFSRGSDRREQDGRVSMSRSHLAWLASGACAVLVAATSASAQDGHHRHDGGGGPRGPAPAGRGAPPQGGPGPGWDQQRYNGYWVGPRWYFGAPQGPAYQAPGFHPGFVPWRRGAYLPPQYLSYVITDYARFRLRRPPFGYAWVGVGGEFLLVSMTTGMIFDVVTGY
jgi:Ni/Co efflux regulator RcnB